MSENRNVKRTVLYSLRELLVGNWKYPTPPLRWSLIGCHVKRAKLKQFNAISFAGPRWYMGRSMWNMLVWPLIKEGRDCTCPRRIGVHYSGRCDRFWPLIMGCQYLISGSVTPNGHTKRRTNGRKFVHTIRASKRTNSGVESATDISPRPSKSLQLFRVFLLPKQL